MVSELLPHRLTTGVHGFACAPQIFKEGVKSNQMNKERNAFNSEQKDSWNSIKTEYVNTNISYRKLAERRGVSFNTLKARAKRENWAALRKEKYNKVTTKIVNDAVSNEYPQASLIYNAAGLLVNDIARTVEKGDLLPIELAQLARALKVLKEIIGAYTEMEMRLYEARILALEKKAYPEVTDNTVVVEFVNADWGV